MLMFTVLACSTGPTELEVDNLKKAHIAQLEKNTALQNQIDSNEENLERLLGILDEGFTSLDEGFSIMAEKIEELETELNNPKLVDFIVTYKAEITSDNTRVKIEYLAGDETKSYSWPKTSQCSKDTLIGAPLPLSCR